MGIKKTLEINVDNNIVDNNYIIFKFLRYKIKNLIRFCRLGANNNNDNNNNFRAFPFVCLKSEKDWRLRTYTSIK